MARCFPAALKIIRKHKWLAWNSSFDARLMVQTCLQTGFFDDLKPHLITSIIMAIETRHIDAKAVYDQWYGEFDEKRKTSKGRAWLQQLRATAFQPLAPIARLPIA